MFQATLVPIALCLWPTIYDPLMSVLRRIWNGANPLEPHREFLFHRLIRSGVSHSRATLIYGLMAGLGGLLGLAMVVKGVPEEVRVWMPLGAIVLAACLTYAIERRCRQVQLDAVSQPAPTP